MPTTASEFAGGRDGRWLRTSSKMSSTPWTQLGIPDRFAYPELYFNPPTSRLVVSVADKIIEFHRRLFVREISESVYVPLSNYPDDVTVSSVAVSATSPVAYFVSYRWSAHKGSEGECWSSDWHAITRCDLSSLTLTECAACGELVFDAPFSSGWLCDVLQVEGSGDTVVVRGCALEPGKNSAQYFIGRFHSSTREISLITLLPDPFM
ncbi:MAG: hypothetical protein RL088_3675 [Verrucomicrobiota bacterium]